MADAPRSSNSESTGPILQSVERLRREFERWVDAALQQGGHALDVAGLRNAERQWTPLVDLVETASEVFVDVDLPGLDAAVVDVSLAGNMLTIQGPKRSAVLREGAVTHLSERMRGPFQRSIPLPVPVVHDSVTAEMKSGVLRIRLMKTEKARAMKIPVRTEASPGQPL
jgi:HSP20 family protein